MTQHEVAVLARHSANTLAASKTARAAAVVVVNVDVASLAERRSTDLTLVAAGFTHGFKLVICDPVTRAQVVDPGVTPLDVSPTLVRAVPGLPIGAHELLAAHPAFNGRIKGTSRPFPVVGQV